MNTSAKAVRFDHSRQWVVLADGRTLAVPLAWLPDWLNALPDQRAADEISRNGLHWDAMHEGILVAGLLVGVENGSRKLLQAV
jgi:hypothetical protein